MQRLEAASTLPETITARVNAIVAEGISSKTLYRHLELWHPDHYFGDRSKIPDCEPVSAISMLDSDIGTDPPEPPEHREFYTSENFMKGFSPMFCCPLPTTSNPDHPPRRFAIAESVIPFPGQNGLQLPLLEPLDNWTGTPPSSLPSQRE